MFALHFMQTAAPKRNAKHSEYLISTELLECVCDVCFFLLFIPMMIWGRWKLKMHWCVECYFAYVFFYIFLLPEQRLSCFITFSIRFALQPSNHVSNAYILDFVSLSLNEFRHSSLSDFGRKVMRRENVQHSEGLSCL